MSTDVLSGLRMTPLNVLLTLRKLELEVLLPVHSHVRVARAPKLPAVTAPVGQAPASEGKGSAAAAPVASASPAAAPTSPQAA